MLLDLIATLAAAFGCAGLALAARLISRGRLPRWIVPMSAGLGMLLFSVWNEYTWFDRVTAQLPETVVVASAPADRVA